MGRYEDLSAKWLKGEFRLSLAEEAEVLALGPFCPTASWMDMNYPGGRQIHCPFYGPSSVLGVSPGTRTCMHCPESPQYDSKYDGLNDRASHDRKGVARRLGATVGQARAYIAKKKKDIGPDPQNRRWKEMLTHAIASAPGLKENDKVTLARENGIIE